MAPRKSWLPIPPDSCFSLANLPFGIISVPTSIFPSSVSPHVAVAIGDHALSLAAFHSSPAPKNSPINHPRVFLRPYLNDFAALGRDVHQEYRSWLQEIFAEDTTLPTVLRDRAELREQCLVPLKDVKTHLPFRIGDYTDFFVGKNHAMKAGALIKGIDNALHPNYTHLPVGYHGRASSVVVSGTPITRPHGQIIEDPTVTPPKPIFAPSRRLDFELELGAFLCKSNTMGEPVPIKEAENNIFGYVLMNDWSARDIQGWEMVPLGPFNSKNFATSVSAWVVLADALEPYKMKGIEREDEVLPYMREENTDNVFDLDLEVELTNKSGSSTTISRSNGKNLLFSFPQMLAHHSSGGCPMNVGDLLGSGTITGTQPGSDGSMLELSENGKAKIQLQDGHERTFLEDGDTITLKGWAGRKGGAIVGFGDCVGRVERAKVLA